jgi:hypothetical protein
MTGKIANISKKGLIAQYFGTIKTYLCGTFDIMDGVCKNYAVLRVEFTQWHGSCYNDRDLSTVR